ncbi:MAG: ImcF-related family protein, partial [Pseudomonadota bacterium]
ALAEFLEGVVAEFDQSRRSRATVSRRPAWLIAGAAGALVLALAIYALVLDYRFHRGLMAEFDAALASLPSGPVDARLLALRDEALRVDAAAAGAPLSQIVGVPFWSSGQRALETYRAEVDAALPRAMRDAIAAALEREGEAIELYDNLRAWAILTGESDWSPDFLAGWLQARDGSLGTAALAPHTTILTGPDPTLALPDAEILDVVRGLASAAPEADRAYLELTRLPGARALPAWDPLTEINGLATVVVNADGGELSGAIPGLFTRAGWSFAQTGGVDRAIAITRTESARLLDARARSAPDTPGETREQLQVETLAAWQAFLGDLRVRPFSDSETALRVSAALARRSSPIETLFAAAYAEVGGGDAARPVVQRARIASAFGEANDYFEAGRYSEIRLLFQRLNSVLVLIEIETERGAEGLQGLQDRADTIAALEEAPPLVVQITEDVLARSTAAHERLLTNPIVRAWQREVLPVCTAVTGAGFPFSPGTGTEATLPEFAQLLGPGGAIDTFFRTHAEPLLDTSGDVWRWRPEARLDGVSQDSAEFLRRALTVSAAFFDGTAQPDRGFTIGTLAGRGEARLSLGGTARDLRLRAPDQTLSWPGPDAAAGAQLTFGGAATLGGTGPWGLFHLLDAGTVRTTEGGRVHIVDLRTDAGRLFLVLEFDEPLNPISARRALMELRCPPVL